MRPPLSLTGALLHLGGYKVSQGFKKDMGVIKVSQGFKK